MQRFTYDTVLIDPRKLGKSATPSFTVTTPTHFGPWTLRQLNDDDEDCGDLIMTTTTLRQLDNDDDDTAAT